MPAWGLVKDSPLIYAAQKGLSGGGGGGGRGRGAFSYTFKELTIFDVELRAQLQSPAGGLWKWMEKRGDKAVIGAKRMVGVKTGALRDSIHKRHLANFTGQYLWIGSTQSHALLHHQGTRPHRIAPNQPNTVLKFRRGTRVIHTAQVNHPGTKPNPYLSAQLRHFIG